MGDVVAPSPQESKSGGGQGQNPRKNAAKRPSKNKGKKKRGSAAKAATTDEKSTIAQTSSKASGHGDGKPTASRGGQRNDPKRPANGRKNGWLGKTAYAALDLGTNNCRLLIARPGQGGFTIVDAFSRVVRLGEGLSSSGKMSDEAMDRAVEALGICAEKLKKRNVILARSVATEACRQALNGTQFIERVRKETGIMLDIISPKEEARLAVMGCHALLEDGDGPALIFDIGGGSTELVLVGTEGVVPEILDWVSVPWGVVSLTESMEFDESDPADRIAGYAAMRKKVSDSFAEFAKRLPQGGDYRLLGTSGTVTTLASVYLELPSYDRSQIDGLHLPVADMRRISTEIASRDAAGRAEFPTIGTERADLVVAGCAILESIFDIWPGERLGVADRGIREGILRALIASDAKGRRYG
jgi:exopolyphosphatase/guanosine-5'-triphosphate,3'-diphosphate pyrophosphatase